MKDKVLDWFPELEESAASGGSATVQADVISALVNLGYARNTAERAVAKARTNGSEDTFEVLLKRSLKKVRGQ